MDAKIININPRTGWKAWKNLSIAALLIVSLWGGSLFAITYDNFSSGNINNSLWDTAYAKGSFSVVEGSSVGVSQAYALHMSSTGDSSYPKARIITTETFNGNFRAGINFFNFAYTSNAYTISPTDPAGPSVNLYVGTDAHFFLVARAVVNLGSGAVNVIGWKEIINGSEVHRGGTSYTANSGALLISYVNNVMNLGYSSSTDPTNWPTTYQSLGSSATTLDGNQFLGIVSSGGGGGKTSVDIGSLNYNYVVNPVPLPSAIFLLAPGLLGLIGIKRKYLG